MNLAQTSEWRFAGPGLAAPMCAATRPARYGLPCGKP